MLRSSSSHKQWLRGIATAGFLGLGLVHAFSEEAANDTGRMAADDIKMAEPAVSTPDAAAGSALQSYYKLRWPEMGPEDVNTDLVSGVYELMEDGSLNTILCDGCMEKHHPASLTKMMTLYMMFSLMQITQETAYQDDFNSKTDITIPAETVRYYWNGATNPRGLWFNKQLKGGQKLSMRQLLRNIGLQSDAISTDIAANYVCDVVSCETDNNRGRFVQEMNIISQNMGMHTTQWMDMIGSPADASGKQEYRHFTTANDLAILMATLEEEFPEWSRLTMAKARHVNAGYEWGKTGFTNGNRCLAVLDEHNGRTFISVVMGAGAPGVREELTRKNLQIARQSSAMRITLPSGDNIPVPTPNPRRKEPA